MREKLEVLLWGFFGLTGLIVIQFILRSSKHAVMDFIYAYAFVILIFLIALAITLLSILAPKGILGQKLQNWAGVNERTEGSNVSQEFRHSSLHWSFTPIFLTSLFTALCTGAFLLGQTGVGEFFN